MLRPHQSKSEVEEREGTTLVLRGNPSPPISPHCCEHHLPDSVDLRILTKPLFDFLVTLCLFIFNPISCMHGGFCFRKRSRFLRPSRLPARGPEEQYHADASRVTLQSLDCFPGIRLHRLHFRHTHTHTHSLHTVRAQLQHRWDVAHGNTCMGFAFVLGGQKFECNLMGLLLGGECRMLGDRRAA